MQLSNQSIAIVVLACIGLSQHALADCAIADEVKQLDPVEVGFCESDAVFVGQVEQIVETIHAFTEEGSGRTKHFDTQHSTVKVITTLKGSPAEKVTLLSELYDPNRAFVFASRTKYLIFAKQLAHENEYAGASTACSLQPTLLFTDADKALKQLEQHRTGRKAIDCKNIRPKDKA